MARARIPDPEGVAAVRLARAAMMPTAAGGEATEPAAAEADGADNSPAAACCGVGAGGAGGVASQDGGGFGGVPRAAVATAVRYSMQLLAERAKGNTVEVRVPPFAAVQCIEGPGHTRGTPPNVVEMDAATWLSLATGDLAWEAGIASGRIHASGQRADLRGYVPVVGL